MSEHSEEGTPLLIVFTRASGSQVRNEEVKKEDSKEDQGGEDDRDEGGDGKKKKKEEEGEDRHNEAAKKKLEGKLADYVKKRKFRFLHHYAGPRDPLGAAIHRNAKKAGLDVEVISAEKDWGQDLCADEPFNTHLKWAQEGMIDGYHSGLPTHDLFEAEVHQNTPGPVKT